jgi:NADP-dependent 3-hydroxy acid dehydrogenase YdfG
MSGPDPGTRPLAAITGHTGAIGSAIAAAYRSNGFDLLTMGRNAASDVRADLAADDGTAAACEQLARLPRLDLLVHAAGAYARASIEETELSGLDALLAVNLRAPYALTRAALPALRAAGGTVVFVNSSAATGRVVRGVAPYAVTKAALRALADGLRAEENQHGVSVLSVFVGRTAGPLQEKLHEAEGRRYAPERLLQPDDVAAAILAATSLPGTAELTDLHLRPRKPLGDDPSRA